MGLRYQIRKSHDWANCWCLSRDHDDDDEFSSLEAAHSAAQSDFEWLVRRWILDGLPAPRIAAPAQASTDLLISHLDRRFADHGFAELGVLRSLVRSIAADIRSLEGKANV